VAQESKLVNPEDGASSLEESDGKVDVVDTHVYVVTLRGTTKRYVGITTQRVQRRWSDHKKLVHRSHENRHFTNALKKYGPDAFDWEWLGTFPTWQEGCAAEIYLIAQGLTHYNKTRGGDGVVGYKWTEEQKQRRASARWIVSRATREKISVAKKGKPSSRKGTKASPESIAKMKESAKGKKHSTDHIEKIRASSIGRKHSDGTKEIIRLSRLGKKHSAETRSKLSTSAKGHKPVNLGVSPSEETRKKISESGKGRTPHNKGKKGPKQSEETIAKRVAAVAATRAAKKAAGIESPKRNAWNKGKKLSAEHCQALSDSHKGIKRKPDSIAKGIATRAGKGVPHTEQSRINISVAKKLAHQKKKERLALIAAMGSIAHEVILDG
jgi:hypothetical protein